MTGKWPLQITVESDDDLILGVYRFDDLSFLLWA